MKTKFWILTAMAFGLGLVSMSAKAVPTFARRTGVACSGCHYAVPALNAFGRQFKMNGYRLAPGAKPARTFNDYLNLDKSFPIAAALVARPYNKVKGENSNIQAVHELELYIAGSFGKNWSGFLEFAGEPGEGAEVDHGQVTYSIAPEFNLQIAYGPTFWSDPYDTLTHMRRLRVGASSVIDSAFGGADGDLGIGENRQYVSVNGRVANKLFYSVGYGSQLDNAEGGDPKTFLGRVAFDVLPNVMVGAFTVNGTCTTQSGSDSCVLADRDYSRTGADFQADYDNWRFTGVYMKAKDDDLAGLTQETNNVYTGRVVYTFRDNGRPTYVPFFQYDSHEQMNGTETIKDTTFGFIKFFDENIKATLEYTDTKGDGTTPDDTRFVIQVAAYF